MRAIPPIPAPFVDGRWFNIARDGNPPNHGVYFIENAVGFNHYCYWDGRHWSTGFKTPEQAQQYRHHQSPFKRVAWFGLSKNRLTH